MPLLSPLLCPIQGNICLNILREDWKPVLTITAVVYGLNFLFLVCAPCTLRGRAAAGAAAAAAAPPATTSRCPPRADQLRLATPHQSRVQAPNPDDPLNKEAAQMMAQSPGQFERLVSQSITRGCSIAGEYFPPARGDRSG